MFCKHEANPQDSSNAEGRSQKSHFATSLKSHPRTNTPPEILSTSAEHPPPREHSWGTAPACQKNFKRLNYKRLNFPLQLLQEIQ